MPSMRFYIISIVSIFAALGIGIYIGLAMDAQGLIIKQGEDFITKLEENFEELREENKNINLEKENLKKQNEIQNAYIESTYNEIIKGKLEGLNVAIIETNSDYIYSGIGLDLEKAGAKVISVTTLNNELTNINKLNEVLNDSNENSNGNSILNTITKLTQSIIKGEEYTLIEDLVKQGLVDVVGKYNEPIDYLIITGGSDKDNSDRINQIDKVIVNTTKTLNIPVIGVEKTTVNYSYIDSYKKLRISTVDNIDMTIGKVGMILSMGGIPGNYGIKSSAQKVTPIIELSVSQ